MERLIAVLKKLAVANRERLKSDKLAISAILVGNSSDANQQPSPVGLLLNLTVTKVK